MSIGGSGQSPPAGSITVRILGAGAQRNPWLPREPSVEARTRGATKLERLALSSRDDVPALARRL
jgi:hypothetical protein